MEQTNVPPKSDEKNGARDSEPATFNEPSGVTELMQRIPDVLPEGISKNDENQEMRADSLGDPSQKKNTPETNVGMHQKDLLDLKKAIYTPNEDSSEEISFQRQEPAH